MKNEKIRELNKAIRTLKDYCKSCGGNCTDCPFNGCKCLLADIPEYWQEAKEQYEISTLEKEILKRAKAKEYNYITKDRNKKIYIFNEEPEKISYEWILRNGKCYGLRIFNDLFQFVTWKDEEPTKIDDVLNNHVIIDEKK